MFRRCQALIAVLAIALQAIDGIVAALGHSHGDERVSHAATPATHVHGSACSHHHAPAPLATHDASDPPAESSQPRDHDDCSLCRHFSQPVAPAAVAVAAVRSERVEIFIPVLVERVVSLVPPAHPARGPPRTA